MLSSGILVHIIKTINLSISAFNGNIPSWILLPTPKRYCLSYILCCCIRDCCLTGISIRRERTSSWNYKIYHFLPSELCLQSAVFSNPTRNYEMLQWECEPDGLELEEETLCILILISLSKCVIEIDTDKRRSGDTHLSTYHEKWSINWPFRHPFIFTDSISRWRGNYSNRLSLWCYQLRYDATVTLIEKFSFHL